MRFQRKFFVLGVLAGLAFSAVVWAITVEQIWQNVYDSTNSALKIHQVVP